MRVNLADRLPGALPAGGDVEMGTRGIRIQRQHATGEIELKYGLNRREQGGNPQEAAPARKGFPPLSVSS